MSPLPMPLERLRPPSFAQRIGGILLLLSLALPASPASSAVRTVCALGCGYTTVQAAIGAATIGDEIHLVDPVHTEWGIVVDKSLTIRGVPDAPGEPRRVLQASPVAGSGPDRLLTVAVNRDVVLRDLVLRHGTGATGGGAVLNEGDLVLDEVEVRDNESGAFAGGGINSTGPLVVIDSLFHGNVSLQYGGGIHCTSGCFPFVVRGSRFEQNSAFGGGAVFTSASLEMFDTELIANHATGDGGAGIWALESSLLLVQSQLIGNTAALAGAGLLLGDTSTTLVDVLVQGNQAGDDGGGLWQGNSPIRMLRVRFIGNTSQGSGGGMVVRGAFDIAQSTLHDNQAAGDGGGALIDLQGGRIRDSTFSANLAAGHGGGIHAVQSDSALSLRNVTLHGNQCDGSGRGIYFAGDGELSNVTVTANQADVDGTSGPNGGGLFIAAGGHLVRVRNSIVADNSDDGVTGFAKANDCAGPLYVDGFVSLGTLGLSGLDPACQLSGLAADVGDIQGLGALGDFGGPTRTVQLLGRSPNVNAGDPVACRDENGDPLAADQRGGRRVGICDRGAFERNATAALFRADFEIGGPWGWSAVVP